nr:immunoglobulin light chain junction region [Macaca mulatta]MOW00624.1 immunoglobulin light chain junction region [Macaca mulatta]
DYYCQVWDTTINHPLF